MTQKLYRDGIETGPNVQRTKIFCSNNNKYFILDGVIIATKDFWSLYIWASFMKQRSLSVRKCSLVGGLHYGWCS